jgi:outer membrane protein OmpA-like peptidoglycan-associated protein
MIMKALSIISIFFSIGLCSITFAQGGKIDRATDELNDLAYAKSGDILLKVANKGHRSVELFQKLGDSYYFNNEMQDAAKWYGELMKMGDESIDAEYYFRHSQALKSSGNSAEANTWMQKFSSAKPNDRRSKAFTSDIGSLEIVKDQPKDIEIQNLDFNSSVSDFGTSFYEGSLVFASSRGNGKKYKWNDQPFLDLYTTEAKADGSFGVIEELNGPLSSKLHESSAVFTKDGNVMYFTRNVEDNREMRRENIETVRLQILKSTKDENGKWGKTESVHFNGLDYSVAHPAINPAGTKMYFVSDMSGTIGKSDIFEVAINKDGTLGTPVALGTLVNTEGVESFPYMNAEGDLFFSSNGFNGFGGLDIFVIRGFDQRGNSNGSMKIENIGMPINSAMDDFAYYESDKLNGFFTSNRKDGKGGDDIYSFMVRGENNLIVSGVVQDEETLEMIPGAKVYLLDENGTIIKEQIVGDDASYSFSDLVPNKTYTVRAEKDQRNSNEITFSTPDKATDVMEDIKLKLKEDGVVLEPCDDLVKKLDIPIIYYNFDKSNVRNDAEIDLNKVLGLMNKYPTITIDIRSHTDCRGTNVYNEKLSDRRAASMMKYLVNNGISADRITSKGYGEYQLLNNCPCEQKDDSGCSEEMHQLNRRSEFIVTSVNGVKCDED